LHGTFEQQYSCRTQGRAGSATAHSGKASPEMERLKKLYLGTRAYSKTYEKTPFYPQGGFDTGIYTSELGPGGNSIVNRFHSRVRWANLMGCWSLRGMRKRTPTNRTSLATFEGDALVFRSEFAAEGMKLNLRKVMHPVSAGKIISEEYVTAEGSPDGACGSEKASIKVLNRERRLGVRLTARANGMRKSI